MLFQLVFLRLCKRSFVKAFFKLDDDVVLVVAFADEHNLVFAVAKLSVPVFFYFRIFVNVRLLYVFAQSINLYDCFTSSLNASIQYETGKIEEFLPACSNSCTSLLASENQM